MKAILKAVIQRRPKTKEEVEREQQERFEETKENQPLNDTK